MMDQNVDKIELVNISDEMRRSFLDYSMSVIVSRALPDVRDGLKPVHRRILHAMNELGIIASKPYKNSVNITRMVIRLFMTLWCVWHRTSVTVMNWCKVTEILDLWMEMVLRLCDIRKHVCRKSPWR